MKILLTGSNGFLGKHVKNILNNYDLLCPSKKELDLTEYEKVLEYMYKNKPEKVIHLAATVGGIGANMNSPGYFMYQNLLMGLNLVECSRKCGVNHFVFVGTVCSYPKFAKIPFKENEIWNGYPEETNAPYGIAKKSIMVLLESYKKEYDMDYSILIPTNLYGPYDHFENHKSHVIPALIKKISDAKELGRDSVVVWGDGSSTREFLYVKDAAQAVCAGAVCKKKNYTINLGSGNEISIKDLVNLLCYMIDYKGQVIFDSSKPNGQPRRLVDCSRAHSILGWKASTSFESGLKETIEWYRANR